MPETRVSLSKALKIKNRQAKFVATLQQQISASNSHLVGTEPDFPVKETYARLQLEIERLASIKTAINDANRPIQSAIYRMAELKGLVTFLRGLDTVRGKKIEYMMGEPQEYVAEISAVEVQDEVARIEKEIDRLQDELDSLNARTEVLLDLADEA